MPSLKTPPALPVCNRIKIDSIYSFYYYEHGKNYGYKGEFHNFWEMVYVDSGSILEKADTKTHILPQGSIIFHKPMEFHSMESTGNKPHNVLIITFDCSSPEISAFEGMVFTATARQKRILEHFATEMRETFGERFTTVLGMDYCEKNFASFQAAIAHLEILFIDLIRENILCEKKPSSVSFTKNTRSVFADAVKNYLEEMVEYPLTVSQICDRFNVSTSHLFRIFKAETGKSVMDYYIDLKIARAKLLIREGELNLTQIADRLGYSGIHHFSRIFKSRVNMSPASYAKSIN